MFGDVFEELLRPEVQKTVPWWTWLGALSGAGLGFILANVPGALAGGLAGNRLGAIRDAKGKPVVQVFAALGGNERAQVSFFLPSSFPLNLPDLHQILRSSRC